MGPPVSTPPAALTRIFPSRSRATSAVGREKNEDGSDEPGKSTRRAATSFAAATRGESRSAIDTAILLVRSLLPRVDTLRILAESRPRGPQAPALRDGRHSLSPRFSFSHAHISSSGQAFNGDREPDPHACGLRSRWRLRRLPRGLRPSRYVGSGRD